MSSNYPVLSRIHSSMLATKARIIFEKEMCKSCLPEISSSGPVELEPPYQALIDPEDLLYAAEQAPFVPAAYPVEDDWLRIMVWVPAGQDCDWLRNESVIKQFMVLKYRISFEITGNRDGVLLTHLCHKDDAPIVRAAVSGFFPACEFSLCRDHPLDVLPESTWQNLAIFDDLLTPPPFNHLLTRPSELRLSPLEPLLNNLSLLTPPCLGVYQVLLQPVSMDHDWNRSVEFMVDMEYRAKLYAGYQIQQVPSGQLNLMTNEVTTKANADKPFFCVAVRIALLNHADDNRFTALRALGSFMSLFQHGGRALVRLSQTDYLRVLPVSQVRDMFRLGITYRAGSLLNSAEVSGLFHIPPVQNIAQKGVAVAMVDALPARNGLSSEGIHIGHSIHTAESRAIYIPDAIELCHSHIIGRPGYGKSRLLLYMAMEAIRRGHGIAVLDPHGDLVKLILGHLKEEWLDRVIYFDLGDPEHVPLWNPLAPRLGMRADQITDELLKAFLQTREGFGDRLATLLRQAFYGLVSTAQGTLREVGHLFSPKSSERKMILERILSSVENDKAREFWRNEFENYRGEQITPVQHKLSDLLLHDIIGPMLSQPENRIDLRAAMDESKIFIADLSTAGAERGDTVGALLLSLFFLAALSRSNSLPESRPPFHIYIDETHRLVSDALQNMIAEMRKYNVSLTLSHQYLGQFASKRRIDALGLVGSTIAFNVTVDDAPHVARFLSPNVTPDMLNSLGVREAIARIDRDVVRIMTPSIGEECDPRIRERAKRLSWERYCKPAHVLNDELRRGGRRAAGHLVTVRPAGARATDTVKEYVYDEFLVP